jgi:hypothetical protein
MPKRTLLLIAVLTLLTALLVFLALHNEQKTQKPEQPTANTQVEQLNKTATLAFSPGEVVLTGSNSAAVDVIVDTKENTIDGVQLELLYDPKVVSNLKVTIPEQNFFGSNTDANVILNLNDTKLGRVTYGVGINPQATPKSGSGVVAHLTCTRNPLANVTESVIEILDRSTVVESTHHESVLATSSPLKITVNK